MTLDTYAVGKPCRHCQITHASRIGGAVCTVAGVVFNAVFAVISTAVGRRDRPEA